MKNDIQGKQKSKNKQAQVANNPQKSAYKGGKTHKTPSSHVPYTNDATDIGELIREYIDTPKEELFAKHFDADEWGLANILKAADKRIGKRRPQILAKNKKNKAMRKVIAARLRAAVFSG